MINNLEKYRSEIEGISASEKMKADMKARLLAEANTAGQQKKTAPAPKKFPLRRLALAAAALFVVAGGAAALRAAFFAVPAASAQAQAEAAGDMAPRLAMDGEEFAASGFSSSYFARQAEAEQEAGAGAEAQSLPSLLGPGQHSVSTAAYEEFYAFSLSEYSEELPYGEGGGRSDALALYRQAGEQPTRQALQALAEEQAAALGTAPGSWKYTDSGVTAVGEGFTIMAAADESIAIRYSPAIVPASGQAPAAEADFAQHRQYLEQLIGEYQALLAGMQAPAARLTMTRSEKGEAVWSYQVYDSGGSAAELILNRSTAGLTFLFSQQGLVEISMKRNNALRPVGSYTLISPEEAQGQLEQLLEKPATAGVVQAGLVYNEKIYPGYVLPCYKFIVEISAEQEPLPAGANTGLSRYRVYYISAFSAEDFAPGVG